MTKKANSNPIEPNDLKGWVARPNLVLSNAEGLFDRGLDLLSLVSRLFKKNEPNFFTTKYALSISKTRKWRPKTDPKKRNEPNFAQRKIYPFWYLLVI